MALDRLQSGHRLKPANWLFVLATLLVDLALPVRAQNIVINEIMYHPSSHNSREEYVELFNAGPTNVNLTGWKFTKGANFSFPSNTVIPVAGYLVVAAERQAFTNKYPTVTNFVAGFVVVRMTNVVGFTYTNFENSLSNTRDTLRLVDGSGNEIDSVTYGDDGDWALRQRGVNDGGYQGWTWYTPADGLGRSIELINPNQPNEYGQNWAPSLVNNGTPGVANSVASTNGLPLILDVAHSPIIPQPTNTVAVSARLIDETPGVIMRLFWRVNNGSPPAFTVAPMFDDGAHGDGTAGDGIWGALIPPQANLAIVEFYVEAVDASNQTNSWPRPAVNTDGVTKMDRTAFSVNALYQVDNAVYTGAAPLYKMILTPAEYTELGNMLSGSPSSNASENGTFISYDAQGTEVRYLCSVRNRGHGSRNGNPHNYRFNFVADQPWHGVKGININSRTPYAQHFGAALAQRSGLAGNNSRAGQIRINGGSGPGGTPPNNHYAINEDPDADWAGSHFPDDSGGDIYSAFRDIAPFEFTWRGPNASAYMNTYFKDSNASENDFTDIIAMSRVMGSNDLFTSANVRQVINPEQWLTHIAFMAILDNRETGLNTGYNDDYELYRGINDPRLILAYHDLDTINGQGDTPGSTTASIVGATANNGVGPAMSQFMNSAEFQPLYYRALQNLLDTTFAKTNYDALITETLGFYIPVSTINTMKTWVDGRRSYIQGLLNTYFAANPPPPTATLSGEPRSPTPFASATLTVGGSNVVSYRYKLNNGSYGAETPVGTPISLAGLVNNSTNVVYVMGKSAAGAWQHGTNSPTVSKVWVVNVTLPAVRLNEVLAQNNAAVNHAGTFPDVIELYNEGFSALDLGGLRLTDDPAAPNKFVFPANTIVASGGYLVVYANSDDGSGGLHTGFNLSASGEAVYLFAAASNTVLDAVVFGLQLADLSVGRFGTSGEWRLCTPTFGSANVAKPTGDAHALVINEWLTSGTPPFGEDFVELYNSTALPIDFGNCSFTDEPIGAPRRSPVPPLTFIQSNSFLKLTADGNTGAGADHLNFALSSDQGQIALIDPLLTPIDSVTYFNQSPNVAMGRCPDGANNFVFLTAPSPGAGNLCPAPGGSGSVNVMPYSAGWRYDQTSNLDGTGWMATNYNDTAWLAGQGVLAVNSGAAIAELIRTTLTLTSGRFTYYFRTTFVLNNLANISSLLLTHYIDDGAIVYLNGQEAYRYNMPVGAASFVTPSASTISGSPSELGPFALPMTNLVAGVNYIAVEVHNGANTTSDLFLGVKLDATTNNAAAAGLVINEILANNSNVTESDGSTPDWVEFYNPSSGAVDLGNSSLSDDVALPRKWVFPGGSIIPGRGYYRVFFSSSAPVSGTNTGFGLKDTGDSVYFFASGGGLLDSLIFGLQAVDYSIGRVTPGGSNWVLNVPTPGSTNIAQNLGDVGLVKANEWMANPASGEDWFELYNPNSQPVALADCWLTDDLSTPSTRMKYLIPKLSFLGINAYAYKKFDADNNPQNGADHVNFKLANTEAVGLSQPNGTLIDGVTFTNAVLGVSRGRLPDGSANIVSFTYSQSPGDLNWLALPNIVINEVLSHTDPPLEDAIEIQNTNTASVDITGWFLSDSKNNLKRYQITNSITIPPGAFHVFYETQFNDTSAPFYAFALSSAHGDQVYLSAATNGVLTGYRAEVKFDAAANGVSFGRYRTSVGDYDFVAMSVRTFGVDNPATVAQFRTGTGLSNAYPKVGPIVVSEIMYHPPDIGTNDNTRDEFIELKNITGSAVNLYDPAYPTNRWRLRGGVDFDFPSGTSIGATGTLIVVGFDPVADTNLLVGFKAAYGITSSLPILGPWSGKLDNGGESIELFRPDTPQLPPANDAGFVPFILVEAIIYSDSAPWPTNADGFGMSLQRVSQTGYGNDPTNWVAAAPTPQPGSAGSVDTDGDGMPDAWEDFYGLDKFSAADANLDNDGDGMTNLQEYLAGTDPLVAGSVLRLNVSLTPANAARLRFEAVSNKSYTIQHQPILDGGPWTNLQSIGAVPSNRTVVVTNTPGTNTRFYRVTLP